MSLTSFPAQLPSSPQQPLPVALVVPPELLLAIFTLVGDGLPTHDYNDYRYRRRTLCALTLVHRKWTAPAQEVLRNKLEVWINTAELEERESSDGKEWELSPQTKYFGIWGNLSVFLKLSGITSCLEPVHVKIEAFSTLRIDKLACFTSEKILFIMLGLCRTDCPVHDQDVEALHLKGPYVVRQFEEELCFRNLRRLTIEGTPAPGTRHGDDYKLFRTQYMPNLRHLAWEYDSFGYMELDDFEDLERIDEVMVSLNNQITTLALRCYSIEDCWDEPSKALHHVTQYSNLQHLAVQVGDTNRVLWQLFPKHVLFELESLHLTFFHYSRKQLRWIDKLRRRQNRDVIIGRIVLYKISKEVVRRLCPEIEVDRYEWREYTELPWKGFAGR